jgi:hypothetical protein
MDEEAEEEKPSPKLVTLFPHNHRSILPTLKFLIEQIEAEEYGEVKEVAVVFVADEVLHVFGMGPENTDCSTAVLLQAGNLQMVNAMYSPEEG